MKHLQLVLALCSSMAFAAPPPVAPTPVAATAQKARTVRATDLRDLPTGEGKLVEVIPANVDVVVVERRGGWYRVRISQREGWMRLTAVRFATATPDASGSFTAPLAFLRSGRSGAQTGTVTTGVRGLSETDLANSTPDTAAVDALEARAVPQAEAEAHASELGLVAAKVPFIKAPKKDGGKDDDEGGE